MYLVCLLLRIHAQFFYVSGIQVERQLEAEDGARGWRTCAGLHYGVWTPAS